MPSKTDTSNDFAFVMTCMQHCSEGFPKPDFEAVAKAIGAKSGNACYHRLWRIKTDWGMTGSKKAGAGANGTKVGTPKTPKSTNKRKSNGEKKDDDGEAAGDGDKGDEETPTKKAKVDSGEEKQAVKDGVVGDGETVGE